jgi:hypothetical protein
MESFESIDVFDFDCEMLRPRRSIYFQQSVRMNWRMPMEARLPLEHTGGEAGLLADGFEDPFEGGSEVTSFRYRILCCVHYSLLYTEREQSNTMNNNASY